MSEERRILVTGVSGYWGARVARVLVNQPGLHVFGIDGDKPEQEIVGLDYIQSDIRNPLLVDLLVSEKIDTVCHLDFVESNRPNEAAFDHNVMGTVKVLGACAEAKISQVLLKSSTLVYGAHPGNPAFISEDRTLKGGRSNGTARDLMEIEAYCKDFQRNEPEIRLAILRFSSIVGLNVDTPMTRFLAKSYAPVLFGFDPMMQIIHEDDVVDALVHALKTKASGVFNVAGEDVLPLSKIMGLAGVFPMPVIHFFAYWGSGLLGSGSLDVSRYMPIAWDELRYPWVGDLSRMREELLFIPKYTAEQALAAFREKGLNNRYTADGVDMAYDEERLRETLDLRRQARQSQNEDTVINSEEGRNE